MPEKAMWRRQDLTINCLGLAFPAMHESLGRPPAMLVDLRPLAPPMLVVGSYQLAEQIVKSSN